MKKTVVDLLAGILVVVLLLPSVTATQTFGNKKDVFKDCYIETSGSIEPTCGSFIRYVIWKHFWFRTYGNDRAFVLL